MLTVSQIIKIQRKKQTRELQSTWSRIGLLSALFISLLMVTVIAMGSWYYFDLTRGIPSIDMLPELLQPPDGVLLQPSKMYDRTHEHVILTLQNPAAEGRQYLWVGTQGQTGVDQVSQNLINATVSNFDPGFWQEPVITLQGISEDTNSTLAQQLVSDLLLENEPASLRRNVQKRLLAWQMITKYGREKVLEWYLNSAQYGGFVYGADAAARVYLGKPATQLTIAEAAILTAMADSPRMDPWTGGQMLRDRQVEVIQGMLANGLIDQSEAGAALRENIQFQPRQVIHSLAPALTDLTLMQLSWELPLESVYRGGYEIVTTLDYDLQIQAACAVRVQIDRLQGFDEDQSTETGTPCEESQLLPTLSTGINDPIEGLSASVILLDPQVGEILAWIGGDGADPSPQLPARHPAGTILSPFVYLTAFTHGFSPATLLWDLPQEGSLDISKETLAAYHGPVQLRTAFINDYLGAADEVVQQVGLEDIWMTERSFGINTSQVGPPIGTMPGVLNSLPVSLLDSVQAYGVLANQGVMAGQPINSGNGESHSEGLMPTSVLRVESLDGQVWLDWSDAQVRPIVSDQLAYLTTNVLNDAQAHSDNLGLQEAADIGRPVSIKVSVTADTKNGWVIGYIPQLAVGLWMGAPAGGLRADMISGLWQSLMEYASRPMPVIEFTVPDKISRVEVCSPSGLLVSPICPTTVEEVFLEGNEPTQVDNLYQEFMIDEDTGLLATIFTPPETVEKKLFLVVPTEAVDWAKATGLPIPPETYDDIHPPLTTIEEVEFTQPQMLDYVGGQIEIYGSATGENFSYYRLQVGQGLNPQQWIQIGSDNHQPVHDGQLGTWDTAGLEGMYVVEMLVVRQDQRVDRSFLPVTVDNTAPQVRILSPKENTQLTSQAGKTMIMQASVSDNLALGRVEFYVDGALVSTQYEPPFIVLWYATPGEYELQVRAYDRAANRDEIETTFSIDK